MRRVHQQWVLTIVTAWCCWWWSLTWCPWRVAAQFDSGITSELLQVTHNSAVGGVNETTTRVCMTLSSDGGLLGGDNKRRQVFTTQAYNKFGQLFDTTVTVDYTDPFETFIHYWVGDIPEYLLQKILSALQPRLLLSQTQTELYTQTVNNMMDFLSTHSQQVNNGGPGVPSASSNLMSDVPPLPSPAARRLLQFSSDAYSFSNAGSNTNTGDDFIDYNELTAPSTRAYINATKTVMQNNLTNAQGVIQAANSNLRDLQASNANAVALLNAVVGQYAVENETEVAITKLVTTDFANFNKTFTTQSNIAQQLFQQYLQMEKQNSQQLDAAVAGVNKALQTFATAAQNFALQSAQTSEVALAMVANLQGQVNLVELYLEKADARLNVALQLSKLLNVANDDFRLNTTPRRALIVQDFAFRDLLANVTNGLLRVWSSQTQPPVRPLGFVPTQPGTNQYYVTIQSVWNIQVDLSSTSNPQDMDMINANDSVHQTRYQQQVGNNPVDYVLLRNWFFYCSPEFLVTHRDMWFTVYDLMNYTGPAGCTPFVNCNCWVTETRERCSTSHPYVGTALLTNLASSGLCIDANELSAWYRPSLTVSDQSITGLLAQQTYTTLDDFNTDLSNQCQFTLIGGTRFNFHSSTFQNPDGSAGPVIQFIGNNPTQCSSNSATMVEQSAQLSSYTFPYAMYLLMNLATQVLYQNVSIDWEIQMFGTVDQNEWQDDIEGWAVGDYRKPNTKFFNTLGLNNGQLNNGSGLSSPPVMFGGSLVTAVIVGPNTVPAYVLVRQPGGIQQTVTVTMTNEDGVAQQILTQPFRQTLIESLLSPVMCTAGYWDCTSTDCDMGTAHTGPYVFDTFAGKNPDDGDLSCGNRQLTQRRNKADYPMLFSVPFDTIINTDVNATGVGTGTGTLSPDDLARFAPTSPDSDFINRKPMFDVDAFNAQEQKDSLYAPHASTGIYHTRRRLIIDTRNKRQQVGNVLFDGYRCDPAEVAKGGRGMGQLCSLVDKHRILTASPDSLFPNIDASETVSFAQKSWEANWCFDVPGSHITSQAAQEVKCPNPQQININTASTTGSVLATSATLTIQNGFSTNLTLNVVVQSTPSVSRCTLRLNRTIAPAEPLVVSLFTTLIGPCTDVQTVTIREFSTGNVCWTWTGNVSTLAIQKQQQTTAAVATPPATGSSQPGTVSAAIAALDLSLTQRLTVSQTNLNTAILNTVGQHAITSMVANLQAVQMAQQVATLRSQAMFAAPRFNETYQGQMQSLVQNYLLGAQAFAVMLQSDSAQIKQADALIGPTLSALQNNLSSLSNEIRQDQIVNAQFGAFIQSEAAQEANISQAVADDASRLRALVGVISPLASQINRGITLSQGAPLLQSYNAFTSTFWSQTQSLAAGTVQTFTQLAVATGHVVETVGQDAFGIAQQLYGIAIKVMNAIPSVLDAIGTLLQYIVPIGIGIAVVCFIAFLAKVCPRKTSA